MRLVAPIACSLLALSCTEVSAAEIKVQEFGSMTRILLPVQRHMGMTIAHPPRRVKVEASSGDLGLIAPAVRQNSRLSKLDVWKSDRSSGIDLAYTCDCTSSSYLTEAREVVIDIVDRSRPPTAVPAKTITRQRNTPQAPAAVRAPRPFGESESLRLSRVLVATPFPPVRPGRPEPMNDFDSAIEGIRSAVEAQINEAALQGQITLSGGNGFNRKPLDKGCPDEAALDLRRLTDTVSFREPIPSLRAAVLDEMKQINPTAVRALSRHFVAFGLGTEAKAVFGSFGTGGEAEDLIIDMANYLDGEFSKLSESALFYKQCGRNAAVWRAALAAVQRTGGVREAYAAADGAVLDLPDTLRLNLGAQIALGLIDEGDKTTAMRIWRNLENARGPETAAQRLLRAYIQPEDASEMAPLSILADLSETRTPEAIPAVLRATEILIKGFDRGDAKRVRQSLDDLIYIYEGTDKEAGLVLARAKMNARYGNLASALQELKARLSDEPENAGYWSELIQRTIRSAIEGADPIERPGDFAKILRVQSDLDQSPQSDVARLSLARQAVDSGAAHVATDVLPKPVLARSMDARKIMAEAALKMGRSKQAITLLNGAKDKDSIALRRRAMTLSADDVRTVSAGRFDTAPTATQDAPLAHARQLLDQSITDLTTVEEMLSDG